MIKISFDLKKLGKKLTIGIITPNRNGVTRLKSLSNAKERIRNGQLVITKDGLGTIKEYKPTYDEKEKLIIPHSVSVYVRNLKNKCRTYKISECNVVNIIDNKSGDSYPATESDYSFLLMDDAPVTFRVTRKDKAALTDKSRKQLSVTKIFARKQNGIKIFNELIEKGIWNPLEK
jgi:hypothetical protein